ncbi:hypothetical protein [Streptomyces sp. NPDC051776]|uniref:hypothetical protein n=1 Tax=Streptomyces sp. NPDC051776 TaxID=3155414 RepID=UPI00343478E5
MSHAAALVVAVSLLTTACVGNDDKPKADGRIADADAEESAAKTSPTPGDADATGRPEITLPRDITEKFDGWKTGDRTRDAILADAGRAQSAVTDAVVKGDPEDQALHFYYRKDALTGSQDWVKTIVDDGLTFTGSVRYFAPDLKVFDSTSRRAGLLRRREPGVQQGPEHAQSRQDTDDRQLLRAVEYPSRQEQPGCLADHQARVEERAQELSAMNSSPMTTPLPYRRSPVNHRSVPVAAAFAATAALLLTGCGSGDEPKDNGKVAGADESGTKKPASPKGAPTDGVKRPSIKLPGDVENVFVNWKAGDPVENAVLADAGRRINATDAAIASDDAESKAIPFYYKGDALLGAAEWIQGYKNDGLSITGTTRYFSPKVTKYSKTAVGLFYCSDESKAFNKDRKTKKVDKSPVNDDSYVLYNTRLDKNELGVWQTTVLTSERGSKKCLR